MTYGVLFFADLHLCNSLPYAKPTKREGVTDRLLDQLKVVEEIGAIAKKLKVDAIFGLGDIFERRLLDAVTLRHGVEAIRALAKVAPVYILPGNHDAHGPQSSRYSPEIFEVMGDSRVTYLRQGVIRPSEKIPNLAFHTLPWCPTEQAKERLARMAERRERGEISVLLLHHPIMGNHDGQWVCNAGLNAVELCKGWRRVLAGHFHERQGFGEYGEYVGAPMQLDQRDAGSKKERGVLAIFFGKKGDLNEVFHPITSPRFHTCYWTENGPGDLGDAVAGDYIRVGVEATHAAWPLKYADAEVRAKELRSIGFHIDIFHKPIPQTEIRMKTSKLSTPIAATSEYVEHAEKTGLNTARLLEIGNALLQEAEHG